MQSIRLMEEFSANTWPAFSHIFYDGWLLRFTAGYSRHNNCVWPLSEGELPLDEKLAFCSEQYANRGETCGFRLSTLPAHDRIEARLLEQGYVEENPNLFMTRSTVVGTSAEIMLMDLDEWLETAYRIHPVDDPGLQPWERSVLALMALPTRFAVVVHDGDACAYGRSIRQGRYLSVEDLWTRPDLRGRGIGSALIQGLLQCGREDGATVASVTVNETNWGARRLYERIGFETLYRYRYLVTADPARLE